MEAHGTGTKAGDPQEMNTVADVFCSNGRKGPLLIGSTKSNMGHPEPASGTCLVFNRYRLIYGYECAILSVTLQKVNNFIKIGKSENIVCCKMIISCNCQKHLFIYIATNKYIQCTVSVKNRFLFARFWFNVYFRTWIKIV